MNTLQGGAVRQLVQLIADRIESVRDCILARHFTRLQVDVGKAVFEGQVLHFSLQQVSGGNPLEQVQITPSGFKSEVLIAEKTNKKRI